MAQFGYFLSAEELTPSEIVRYAQEAEAAGFDRVWVSDHYHPWLQEQGQSPFVWSVLGAIAATTNLQMTTAVTCPTFRIHPAVMAQATATTAAMAPGRFTFGVGSGEALNEHILGDAWPPVSVRQDRLREAIAVIRRLWTGETVTHEGTHFTVHNAQIFSLPETPPDILISGFGPAATELAAQIGDGWITVGGGEDELRGYRDFGGTGRTQVGMKICWASSEEEAARTAYRVWGHEGYGGQLSQDVPMWQGFEALKERSGPEAMKESVACGPDAEKAAEQVREKAEAGYDEVYVAQMGPDQSGGIRFLAEQVLPLLR